MIENDIYVRVIWRYIVRKEIAFRKKFVRIRQEF